MPILWIYATEQHYSYPISSTTIWAPQVSQMGVAQSHFSRLPAHSHQPFGESHLQQRNEEYQCPFCICQYLKKKVREEPEYTNIVSCLCNTSSLVLSILGLV